MTGTVHAVEGGVYRVVLKDGSSVDASLRGRLKRHRREGSPAVIGDRVVVSRQDDTWTVDEVLPRASQLVRRGAGGRRAKVVAANVDRVFAVVAARDPDASLGLVDRLLVVVESSGLHAVLVVNKVDLEGASEVAEELRRLYEPIGYRVVTVSAASGEGVDTLAKEMAQGTSAFMGPSGAGKSSLLNAVDPTLELRTGALSRKTGTGRHTTVSSRLIPLASGGLVADTPGFGDVGLWDVASGDVGRCFPEVAELAPACRFRGCAHIQEPDCAVLAALDEGRVARSRYESYLRLREEAEASEAR